MENSFNVRVKKDGSAYAIRMIISHPMESGQRKNAQGDKIPAHFIQEVVCKHRNNTIFTATWGPAVAKNPYLSFRLRDAKAGELIQLSWVDNKGNADSQELVIPDTP